MPPEQHDVERWVAKVFDHPGEGPEWYWDLDADTQEPEPAACVRLLGELFLDSAKLLARFSDAQLGRGLWYLISNACSSYSLALLEPEVDLPARLRCIDAVPSCSSSCSSGAAKLGSPISSWAAARTRSTPPATCGGTCFRAGVHRGATSTTPRSRR